MNTMLKDLFLEINEQSDGTENKIYPKYSGRGMFGEHCIAVVGPDPLSIILDSMSNLIQMGNTEYAVPFLEMMKEFRQDQMGKGYVIYFPEWKIEDEDDEEFMQSVLINN